MGDERCHCTPGKVGPVWCLRRLTKSISDRDINNSVSAGEWIKINHWLSAFCRSTAGREIFSNPEIFLSSSGCKWYFFHHPLWWVLIASEDCDAAYRVQREGIASQCSGRSKEISLALGWGVWKIQATGWGWQQGTLPVWLSRGILMWPFNTLKGP